MSLSDYFRAQAEWRRAKAVEYPEDERNAQSARALESLAEYVEHEDAAVMVRELEPYQVETFILGGEETQREVARYGFGFGATSTLQHRAFLVELLALCVEDAYESVREGASDDDYSDTLLPHELEAARADVALPRRYFQLRARMTEAEMVEWVETERAADEEVDNARARRAGTLDSLEERL